MDPKPTNPNIISPTDGGGQVIVPGAPVSPAAAVFNTVAVDPAAGRLA